jgi:hypothetical protein
MDDRERLALSISHHLSGRLAQAFGAVEDGQPRMTSEYGIPYLSFTETAPMPKGDDTAEISKALNAVADKLFDSVTGMVPDPKICKLVYRTRPEINAGLIFAGVVRAHAVLLTAVKLG